MVYIKSTSEQTFLLPTDLRKKIAQDHICFLIEEVVNQLDFSKFDEAVAGAGNPSYHPRINLKIILNGICDRITSTRQLEKQTNENIVFMYLAENLNPDFHTIAMFRKNNGVLIKQCFLQTVEVAKKLDMTNFSKLYLDGIKIKANASKSKNFSKEEVEFLSNFVDDHLEKMDEVEKRELNEEEVKIPQSLTNKSKLRDKIKQILKNVKESKKSLDKAKGKIEQEKVDKVNLTDMDSKIMKMKKGFFDQAYNCQLLVEDKTGIIVGNHLSNSPVDVEETKPTMEKFKEEQKIDLEGVEIFQDNGYSGSKTAAYYEEEKAIAYIPDVVTTQELHGKTDKISEFDNDKFELDFEKNQVMCPGGYRMDFVKKYVDHQKKGGNWTNIYKTDKCKECPLQAKCANRKSKIPHREVRINPLMRKIRLRFRTKEGLVKYNKRFHKGEVAQAHIEHNLGYREFKTRSKGSCENEVNLFSIAYNLKKIQIYKKNNAPSKSNCWDLAKTYLFVSKII